MPFSVSSGVVAITGTETISTLFSSSVNNPSGNLGTYLDRLTQSGGNTTNGWIAYSCKSPLRMAINSGTFTITGHAAIDSVYSHPSVAVIAVNGGTLNIGQSFTNPNNSAVVPLDFKTSLQFTAATIIDAYRVRNAGITTFSGATLNITGTRIYISSYIHLQQGSTNNFSNSDFLIDVEPNNNSNYYAFFFVNASNTSIENCRFIGRQGISGLILCETVSFSDVSVIAMGTGIYADNPNNQNATITLLRTTFTNCTNDIMPFQATNGGHLFRLRNTLKVASAITVENASDTSISTRTGTLLIQGSLNRKVVDGSGSSLSGVTVWYRDTNNGNRNNSTNGSDTLGRAYGADQTATLTTNGSGDITETWLNCRIWHKPTQATVAVADDRGPFTIRYRNFAHLFEEEILTSDLLSLGSSSRVRLITDPNVSGTKSGAAGLSGISLNHSTRAITISGSITLQNIYNRYKSELIDTPATNEFLEFIAATNTLSFSAGSLSISSASNLSAGTVNLANANLTLTATGNYSAVSFRPTGTSTVTVTGGGTTNLQGSIFSSTTINRDSGSATVVVDQSQIANITAGTGVTLQIPDVFMNAANFADGTRVQVSHRQIFTIASTAINTTTDVITLGNDLNGDAANFRTTSPNTLVRFQLTSGATIPTSTPQIIDGGLYYWKSGGQLSLTEGGTAINFTTQGSGNFTLIAETEIDNSVVSGGAGYSFAFVRSNNARIRLKAIHWSSSAGTAACSSFYDQVFAWSTSAGITILDTVNNAVASSQDTIHQQLVAISSINLEGAVIDSTGASITSVTLPDDGSTVSGLTIALEGTGKVQINANDANGFITWQELYLWGCYIRSTQAGIRLSSANTLTASSIYNYTFNNLEIDNISSTVLQIVGGIGRSSDGSSLVSSTTTGAVILNAVSQGTGALITTGGGGLDAAGVRAAIGLASANLDTQLANARNVPTIDTN